MAPFDLIFTIRARDHRPRLAWLNPSGSPSVYGKYCIDRTEDSVQRPPIASDKLIHPTPNAREVATPLGTTAWETEC